jgi:uncharacterized integral membrane protein (TIGR00698 family)
LHLAPADYGLWSGASIHEIAQVIAAAFQHGSDAGQFGTIAKLTRVMMLAPLILILGWIAMRRGIGSTRAAGGSAVPMPWFVFGFLALVGLNSVISIDPAARAGIAILTNFLLAMALAAMGLGTVLHKLIAAGSRPLLLGGIASLFISCLSLVMILFVR